MFKSDLRTYILLSGAKKTPQNLQWSKKSISSHMIFHEKCVFTGGNRSWSTFPSSWSDWARFRSLQKIKSFFLVTSIYDDRCYTSKSIEKNFWLPATVFSFVLKFSPIAPGPHSMLAIVFNRLFIAPVPRSMFCMWMFVFKGRNCKFARQHWMGYGGWSECDTLHMKTLNGVRGMKWKWNLLC